MEENGKFLTREDLARISKRRYAVATIPGYGNVRIQSMTERERSQNEFYSFARMQKGGDSAKKDTFIRVRARAVQLCVVNAEGKREYPEGESGVEEILEMDARVTELITDAIEAHCGFETPTEADHDDLEKKSGTTPAVGSPTS